MIRIRSGGLATVVALCSATVAFAGPDWVENGDAGSTVGTGQKIIGDAAGLTTIFGSLSSGRDEPDLEDLYLVRIIEPTIFRMDMRSAPFDSQIFIFRVTEDERGFGVIGNDDADSDTHGSALDNAATDGTMAAIVDVGIYAIGITVAGRFPVSAGGPIFSFANRTEVSGPDGVGGQQPLVGWEGSGSGGPYLVSIRGTTFYGVPSPGCSMLAGVGIATIVRRRRR